MEGKIQILMNSPAAEEEESAPKKTRRTSSKAAPSLELFNESQEQDRKWQNSAESDY